MNITHLLPSCNLDSKSWLRAKASCQVIFFSPVYTFSYDAKSGCFYSKIITFAD